MTKHIFLTAILLSLSIIVAAQSTLPGIRFQAVAREINGDIIASQHITTKLEIFSIEDSETVLYEEFHKAKSNPFGLINLTLGEGLDISGSLDNILWERQDLWVRISVKNEEDNQYSSVSTNQFNTVPYAYFSNKAGTLSEEQPVQKGGKKPPKPHKGGHWDIEGNIEAHERSLAPPLLGNADYNPLVLITNNTERMRITEDGDIIMAQALNLQGNTTMDADLTVEQNVHVNTVGGTTKIDGPTTIGGPGMNQARFRGPVTMDKTVQVVGATNINNILDVYGGTRLHDIMDVDGATTLNNTLDVDGPTTLNSNLDVDFATTLNNSLDVDGQSTLNNTLDVDGPATLNGTLDVDYMTTLNNTLDVDGQTTLNNSMDVDGSTTLNSTLDVDFATTLNNTLDVDGTSSFHNQVNILAFQQASSPSTGALTIAGGVGIGGDLNIGGSLSLNNRLFVEANVAGPSYTFGQVVSDDGYVAVFSNTNNGFGDGIKIKLGKTRTSYALDINNLPPEIRNSILGNVTSSSEQMKNLIKCNVPNKLGILQNVVFEGGLEDAKLALGAAIGLTNGLIDILNDELGLSPNGFNVSAPVQVGLQNAVNLMTGGFNTAIETAVDFPITSLNNVFAPIDFTAPLNTALTPFRTLTLGVPAISLWGGVNQVIIPSIPQVCDPTGVTDICTPATPEVRLVVPGISIPQYSLGTFTIFPTLPSFTLPSIPSVDVPDLNVALPQLPSLIIPKIPSLDFASLGIPSIDVNSLSFWGVPNICLDETSGTSPLNNDNEFLTFVDKDNNKMGSIKAVSVTDWSKKYLNPLFLSGLRDAITQSKTDKLHGKYHFKLEVNKALMAYANIGVEYRSGNGDYAEWLERMDGREIIQAGDIIGVIGGKITKDLSEAEQVMAVSHAPIVLGNVPDEQKIHLGNNIAFIGQVPVKILGPVSSGDYIVGNNVTPGYGMAIHPDDMTIDDYMYVVGRSWEDNQSRGVKMVNTVLGVKNGEYTNILMEFEENFKETDSRFDVLESKVARLSKRIDNLRL